MINQQRSGFYADQSGGYKAFIPSPLPPVPPVEIAGELQELLYEATQSLGRLDGSIYISSDVDNFVSMYMRKEAVLSNRIEGIQSSLHDVLASDAQILPLHSSRQDVEEITRYIQAMNYGMKCLQNAPVSIQLIRDIHKRLLCEVRGSRIGPGEIRKTQNWIGPGGCSVSEAIYVPPPPELDELPRIERGSGQFLSKAAS